MANSKRLSQFARILNLDLSQKKVRILNAKKCWTKKKCVHLVVLEILKQSNREDQTTAGQDVRDALVTGPRKEDPPVNRGKKQLA